jgi:hypothetical protein
MNEPIFSGDKSREMWNEINKSKTIADLRMALYGVCCKLQELESIVSKKKDKNDFITVRTVIAKVGQPTKNGLVFSEEALKTAASKTNGVDKFYYDSKTKELTTDVQVPCIKG